MYSKMYASTGACCRCPTSSQLPLVPSSREEFPMLLLINRWVWGIPISPIVYLNEEKSYHLNAIKISKDLCWFNNCYMEVFLYLY